MQIASLANACDGVHISMTLAEEPSGTLRVYASPIPEELGDECSWISTGPKTYSVTVPEIPRQGSPSYVPYRLVYVKASETAQGGTTTWSNQAAVWVGLTNADDVLQVMRALRDRIWNNKAGIEAALRTLVSGITLKQVIYGTFAQLENYPCIEITQQSLDEPYIGSGYYRLHAFTANIEGHIASDSPKTSDEELSACFGRAVQHILNQKHYEAMVLPSGLILSGCQAQTLQFYNTFAGRWFASWSMTWRGECGGAIA